MTRSIYTFACDAECPKCKADLREYPAVLIRELPLYVDGTGILAEENGAQLCLSDSEPAATCHKCGAALDLTPQEEI